MLIIFITLFIIAYFLYAHYAPFRRLPPGPLSLPFVGNLHQINPARPHKQLAAWGKEYNGIYTIQFGGSLYIILTDVHLIREALLKNADAFSGRTSNFISTLFSDGKFGIVASDGAIFRHNRRFALHTLRDFGVGRNLMEFKIRHQTDWLISAMEKVAGTDLDYSLDDDLQLTVGSIICDILLNCVAHTNREEFFELIHRLEENFALFRTTQLLILDVFPWLRFLPVFDGFNYNPMKRNLAAIKKYFQTRIDERERQYDPTSEQEPSDFIEAFLLERYRTNKLGNDVTFFNNHELLIMVIDLWMAGMETVVTTMKWAILYLLRNPQIQSRCRAEIHAVLGRDTPVTLADRQRMPYTMATISEVQRMGNILPVNLSHCTTQAVTIGGHHIPAGVNVIPQIAAVLSDADVFEQPNEFRPERFLMEDMTTTNKEALENLIPFSLGKRQCLGESLARAELFQIFVSCVQKYTFFPVPDQPMPSDEPVLGFTLTPQKYKMRVKKCSLMMNKSNF